MIKLLILFLVIYSSSIYSATGGGKGGGAGGKGGSHKGGASHGGSRGKVKTKTSNSDEESFWLSEETDYYGGGTGGNPAIGGVNQGAYENIILGYSNHGWDFYGAFINAQATGPNNIFTGETLFTIAKTFHVTNYYDVMIASQNGLYLGNIHPQFWLNYTYADNRVMVQPWLMLHSGLYFANAGYTGTYNQIGSIDGIYATIVPDKLALQIDYISGHTPLSGVTATFVIGLLPNLQMYMGMNAPEKNSGNEFSGILGFNLSTKKL